MYWLPSAYVLFASSSAESFAACGSCQSATAKRPVQAASIRTSQATAPAPSRRTRPAPSLVTRSIAMPTSATASGATGMK